MNAQPELSGAGGAALRNDGQSRADDALQSGLGDACEVFSKKAAIGEFRGEVVPAKAKDPAVAHWLDARRGDGIHRDS